MLLLHYILMNAESLFSLFEDVLVVKIFFLGFIRRRKANHDQAMAKFKEGDVNAASELFQVLFPYCLNVYAECHFKVFNFD